MSTQVLARLLHQGHSWISVVIVTGRRSRVVGLLKSSRPLHHLVPMRRDLRLLMRDSRSQGFQRVFVSVLPSRLSLHSRRIPRRFGVIHGHYPFSRSHNIHFSARAGHSRVLGFATPLRAVFPRSCSSFPIHLRVPHVSMGAVFSTRVFMFLALPRAQLVVQRSRSRAMLIHGFYIRGSQAIVLGPYAPRHQPRVVSFRTGGRFGSQLMYLHVQSPRVMLAPNARDEPLVVGGRSPMFRQ